ncbi:MAG: hypothetical protein J6O51_10685 [Bacteroidales bacterium]|nr:hypothetical protein [Bacteroidales bacterium]
MMRNTLLSVLSLVLVCWSASAQEKIKEVVTSNYNRNSVSIVNIQRGDSYDSNTQRAVSGFSLGDKYDINNIRTKSLRMPKTRTEGVSQTEVDEVVANTAFAREILASIFNRDSNGMMDDKTVRYRGNYDAKDQDVINARAARVGTDALGDLGHGLVSGSYIVLTDFYKIERNTDSKGNVYWTTNAQAYAYKIGMDRDALDSFYEQCWIYDDDDQAAREAKNRAFRNLDIPMIPVARATSAGTGSSVEEAAESCMGNLITGLENRIPAWEVAVSIIGKRPLRAKIGTKEGLKNGDRYRAYSYTEDRNGNLKSVKRGFLRATEISSNTGMSIGETEPSKFYQISGIANIDEGWTIKQSNDAGIGVALGPKFLGLGNSVGIGLDLDYLMNVSNVGSMSYFLLSGSIDLGKSDYLPLFVGLGFGYGLHLTRMFEIMPYAMIGGEHMGYSNSDKSNDRFLRESALVLEPGVRAAVNVAYPLQVFAKAYFDVLTLQGPLYKMYNEQVGHKSGLGIQFGLKWTF